MKKILLYAFFLTIVFSANQAQAMMVKKATAQATIHPQRKHKLKFKEKVGLWILKRKIKKLKKKNKSFFQNLSDTTLCSTIILKSGDQLNINLIETTETAVTFTRCNSTDGQPISLSKSDILEVRLADGLVIYKNDGRRIKPTSSSHSDVSAIGTTSVLMSLLGVILMAYAPFWGVLFGLVGLVLGVIHLTKSEIGQRGAGLVGLILGLLAIIVGITDLE